ncbi:MAG TPA: TolC family protein [Planctomycetota bacterium]|nr:TolC family protein [Planctomycetota bacterium]
MTGRLPDVPAAAPALDDLETAAVTTSLELASARADVAAAANRAADSRLRAWLPHLGVGIAVLQHDDERQLGPAVRIGIPLLDWSSGPRARTRADQQRAEHVLAATAVELRATARAARITALASYAEARHLRDVVLPLRQQIVDETLKHYNAMDADPFALISARQALVDAGHQYVEALRRYAHAMTQVTALRRGVAVEPISELSGSPGDAH